MTDGNTQSATKHQFEAYILLSEPVQFNTKEIAEALTEDYPILQAEDLLGLGGESGVACNTDEFITTPLKVTDGQVDETVLLVRLKGFGKWDPDQIHPSQMVGCHDLKDRLRRNRSYICVSASTESDTLTDRFRAARIVSCLAAVFARLPVALTVYWESAQHFLSPELAIQMADKAASDDWPVMQWIGQNLARNTAYTPPAAQSCTRGLRQFLDYEISFAGAPVDLNEAASILWSTATMALAYGNKFEDGHTIGMEGVPPEKSYRMRCAPRGFEGCEHDLIVLFHPDAYANHEDMFGPLLLQPHPDPSQRAVQPNEGFFKRLIRGARPI